ncbi:MAG TPA: DEDD exonuclease domain-containing protein [Actinomycetota bacterium]|nr:DEDD exonuclease domain-containing protein [Actinomycetota bacterium]
MHQRSFAELGTPLSEVTFCVVDLETTGGSPLAAEITEVGACKVQRGEVVGTFQTLVRPSAPVPAFIRLLTGISDELLADAPPVETVLPSFLEFARNTVLVAHNARFDVGFLNAALRHTGRDRLDNKVVDTANLARKILNGEVPNNRLATLAAYLRCAHQPRHRAFPDVLATIDVLHHLIERVAGYGVTTLEDLVAMSATRMDGTFHKISLADGLPPGIGVYRFLGPSGNTLYVGKATNVRARVRSYFYGDPRRKIRDLLRETQRIDVERCATLIEAEIAEARAIHREQPPYNRAGKRTGSWYVKVSERGIGKVAPARVPKEDGALYLGPFASLRVARTLVDAVRDAAAIHRCASPERCRGCAFSEMGTCVGSDGDAHRSEIARIAAAIHGDPSRILDALRHKMARLARTQRFEEAAELRDRAGLLERALERASDARRMLEAGDVALRVGSRAVLIRDAQLAAAVDDDPSDVRGTLERLRAVASTRPVGSFFPADVLKEARVLVSWVTRADDFELLHVGAEWSSPCVSRATHRFAPRDEGLR